MLRAHRLAGALAWLCASCGDASSSRDATAEQADDAGLQCEAGALLCRALVVQGDDAEAELGFRFGEPRDTDGDGWPDLAAGARFADFGGDDSGRVGVWSGRTGERSFLWDGEDPSGLFGHAVLLLDVDGDDLADVIASAPQSSDEGAFRGTLAARSPATGVLHWRIEGRADETFGWSIDTIDDLTGDGVPDLIVGAPHQTAGGRVVVVDAASGRVVDSFGAGPEFPEFGWYVASIEDLDGDAHADILVGAPATADAEGSNAGAALVISSADGRHLREFRGARAGAMFGEIVTALADIDGLGRADIAVSATHSRAVSGPLEGEVEIYSSETGEQIASLRGRELGELYGRFIGRAPDLDGDDIAELMIGAPWAPGPQGARQGRIELRAGSSLELLFERQGDNADAWFGWHAAPAAAREPHGDAPGLIVGALRNGASDLSGAGALEWFTLHGQ